MTLNSAQMTLNFHGVTLEPEDLELSEIIDFVGMTLTYVHSDLLTWFSCQSVVTLSYNLVRG